MHPIVPLLQLVHLLGKIEGRKRLQKMVHILREIGAPFRESFQYSFYGMYSLQLRREVDALSRDGLIIESQCSRNASFSIEGTSDLERLLAEFELDKEPDWATHASHLNTLSPPILEGVSTILFLRRTETDSNLVRERLLSLKPHLASKADRCFKEADSIAAATIA